MLETVKESKTRWVNCPHCGHKLFRVMSEKPLVTSISSKDFVEGNLPKVYNGCIEIKCHSCKTVVVIEGVAE